MGERWYVTALFPLTTALHPQVFPVPCLLRWHNALLISCVGYVSSGARLPVLVDPELYYFYARIDFAKNRSREAQTAETLGDKIYGSCLYHLLCDWRLPHPCISPLVNALTSNKYQKRIAMKYNVLDLFYNCPKTASEIATALISDFFEASFSSFS